MNKLELSENNLKKFQYYVSGTPYGTIEQLINQVLLKGKEEKNIGNHSAYNYGIKVNFIYFNTVICSVNTVNKTFYTTTGGWETSSTKKAIDKYSSYLITLGFKKLNPKEKFIKQRDFKEIFGFKIPTSSSAELAVDICKKNKLNITIEEHNNIFEESQIGKIKLRYYNLDILVDEKMIA